MTPQVGTSETGSPTGMPLTLRTKFILAAAGFLVVLGVAAVYPRQVSRQAPTVGATVAARITLVASDRRDVQCLSPAGVGEFHCSYDNEATKWRGLDKHTIRPYMTIDRQLYLIVGLFNNDAVNTRYHAEPTSTPREQMQRFTAECQLKVIGTLSGFRVSWQQGVAFGEPQPEAPVATVVNCRVQG